MSSDIELRATSHGSCKESHHVCFPASEKNWLSFQPYNDVLFVNLCGTNAVIAIWCCGYAFTSVLSEVKTAKKTVSINEQLDHT